MLNVRRSIYKNRRTEHRHSPIFRSTTTLRDPRFIATLHGILPWHGPTVYVYVSITGIYSAVVIAASAVFDSQTFPGMRQLSDASVVIGISSFTLVIIYDSIQLDVSNLIWLTILNFIWHSFSISIQLTEHTFFIWFPKFEYHPNQTKWSLTWTRVSYK